MYAHKNKSLLSLFVFFLTILLVLGDISYLNSEEEQTEHFKEHKQTLQQVKGIGYLQGSDVVNFPKFLFNSETKVFMRQKYSCASWHAKVRSAIQPVVVMQYLN